MTFTIYNGTKDTQLYALPAFSKAEVSGFIDKKKDEYGILIGRFQPFHIAHEAIIHEIIADGRIPVVIVGGYGKNDSRHPLSHSQVVECIRKVFPDIVITSLEDSNISYDEWYGRLRLILDRFDNYTIYINDKYQDKTKFEYKGIEISGWYTDIFRLEGVNIKEVTYPKALFGDYKVAGFIHSSNIRKDITTNKTYLDGRVYNYLTKELGWK